MPEGDPQDYLAGIGMLKEQMPAFLQARSAMAMQPVPQQVQQPQQPQMPDVRPPPLPSLPRYQDIPPSPQHEFSDTINVFKNPAVVLATLGSLFTRAPLTAAMNAGGAAMEAYHKGDQETAQLKQKEWEQAARQAEQQNKIELEKYKEAWERRDVDVKQKFAEMAALAAGYKDSLINAAVASGNIDVVEKILVARETAQIRNTQALELYKEKQDLIAKLKPLDSETADFMARQLIEGNTQQLTGLFRSQGAKTQVEEQARRILTEERGMSNQQAAEYVVRKAQGLAGIRAGAQALGRREAQVIGAATTAQATAPRVIEASENVSRTQFPSINRIILMAQQGTGGENVIRLGIAINTFVNNYARALGAGNAVLTDSARREALENLQAAWSKGQIRVAIDQMLNRELPSEITGAKMGMKEFLRKIEEEDKPQNPVRVNSPAEAEKLAPGTVYVTPDGRQYTR